MTPFKRPASAAGAAVLLALFLSACGSSYPTDASKEDFCNALGDVVTTSIQIEGEEPTEDEWEDIQQSYADLGDTGTPEDIGEDERKGFEVVVDTITDLDYDEAKDEFGDRGGEDVIPGVSEEENDNADKFFDYAATECAKELGGSDGGSGGSTETPTEEPAETPTDDGLTTETPSEPTPTEPETTETE